MLGVPSVGLSSLGGSVVPYSSYPSQPGFNSIYLPGYTYRPVILGLMGLGGIRGRPGVYLPYGSHIGGTIPGSGVYIPGRVVPVLSAVQRRCDRLGAPVGVRGGMHAVGGHR